MKVRILYENNSIKFITNKDIHVKELLKSLKNNPNFLNKEFQLLDTNQKVLEMDEIIHIKKNSKEENNFNIELTHNDKKEPEILLYLVPYDPNNSKNNNKKYENQEEFNSHKRPEKYKNTDITDLIMRCTNAKEKLSSNARRSQTNPDRMRIFDFLNSNLGSLANESGNSGNNASANHLNELLNILRPMIENGDGLYSQSSSSMPSSFQSGMPQIHRRVNRPSQNIVPDENLVNNLKEMGFPEDQCRRALIHSRNDISRATDLLLSDGLDYLPSER